MDIDYDLCTDEELIIPPIKAPVMFFTFKFELINIYKYVYNNNPLNIYIINNFVPAELIITLIPTDMNFNCNNLFILYEYNEGVLAFINLITTDEPFINNDLVIYKNQISNYKVQLSHDLNKTIIYKFHNLTDYYKLYKSKNKNLLIINNNKISIENFI